MWPWIKHWRDWAMHDFGFMTRSTPRPQALHCSFEKAGLTLHDQPIPWNAEVVLVEALVPRQAGRRMPQKRFPAPLARAAASASRDSAAARVGEPGSIAFSFPTTAGDRGRRADSQEFDTAGPDHTADTEPRRVRAKPAFADADIVRALGEQNVACQTFVSSQCKGLTASAVLTSPTSLAPLLDLGLSVEFCSDRGTGMSFPPGYAVRSWRIDMR